MDNTAAERALRATAVGHKNYLFAGSDAGGRMCRGDLRSARIGEAERHRPGGLHDSGAGAHRRSPHQPDRRTPALEPVSGGGRKGRGGLIPKSSSITIVSTILERGHDSE